ncbi:hypothetical protein ACS0TY_006170 [Phlomoides rotata]
MRVAIHPPSNSHLCSTWALRYDPIKITKPINPKTSLKPSALSKSSNTSINFNPEFQDGKKIKPHLLYDKTLENFDLPVIIRHSGTVSRYFWDGKELQFVSVDGIDSFSIWDFSVSFENGKRKFVRVCRAAIRNFFLPREVSENYLEYVKWKFLHRVFSSALQVLATQAMFRAIGIGYSRSLPSAAALNWVLKDGLGRLSRCIYTASLASAFDTNLKTAVHKSFAISDNLGEVSAKAQIQTVCFDNVGLLLAATFNILLRNNQRLLVALPFVLYPIFSAVDLFGIYQALKHVHLQTLTKDRLELIINIWIQLGNIPSPAEVSKQEGINFLWSKGRELVPIRIGCLNPKRKIPKLSLMMLKSLKDEGFYFICIENFKSGSKRTDHGILVCLREGARTSDIIMGLLQACYVRKSLLLDTISWENGLEAACDSSDSVFREWVILMNKSKKTAQADVDLLIDKMSGEGWACRNVLLSTQEQARYSFVAE